MAERRLNAEEARLWAQVMASARPLRKMAAVAAPVVPEPASPVAAPPDHSSQARPARAPPSLPPSRPHANTLDASWDRRLARGALRPDATLDLHGHSLHSAHALLDAGLERAIARGDRVLLLVTGRPPRPDSERPHARGAIRAALADWLAASRHAGAIAAMRHAHPRHGGAGALYIVFRRPRAKF